MLHGPPEEESEADVLSTLCILSLEACYSAESQHARRGVGWVYGALIKFSIIFHVIEGMVVVTLANNRA